MNAQRRTSIRRGNKANTPDPTRSGGSSTGSDEHPTQVFGAYRDDPEAPDDADARADGGEDDVVDEWEMALRGDEPPAPEPVAARRTTEARRTTRSTRNPVHDRPSVERAGPVTAEPDRSDERPTQVFGAIQDEAPSAAPEDEVKIPAPKRAVESTGGQPDAGSGVAAQLFGYSGGDERGETAVMPRITDDGWPSEDWDDAGARSEEPAEDDREGAVGVAVQSPPDDPGDTEAHDVFADHEDDEADEAVGTEEDAEAEAPEAADVHAGHGGAVPELHGETEEFVMDPAHDEDPAEAESAEPESVVGHWDPQQWAAARTEASEQPVEDQDQLDEDQLDGDRGDEDRGDEDRGDEDRGDEEQPDGEQLDGEQAGHEQLGEEQLGHGQDAPRHEAVQDGEPEALASGAPAEAAAERTELIPAYPGDSAEEAAEEAAPEDPSPGVESVEDEAPGERTELIPAYPAGGPTARLDDETAAERTEFIPTYTPDGAAIITEPGGKPQPVANPLDATVGDRATKSTKDARRRPVALVAVLLLVAVLGGGGAYLMSRQAAKAERTTPSANLAMIDLTATAQVKGEMSKAVQAIYSYDSATLDQSEAKALSFITGDYANEFKQNFAAVRKLGPQAHISLASTVAEAGVESLSDRRATLLMMVNQVGRRGDNGQPLKAQIRLSVTAQKVGGQWKVSNVAQR